MEKVLYIYGTTPTTFKGRELPNPHKAIVAVVLDEEDNVVATGAAICSEERPKGGPKPDYFHKKVGRSIALQRAMNKVPQYSALMLRNFNAAPSSDQIAIAGDQITLTKRPTN